MGGDLKKIQTVGCYMGEVRWCYISGCGREVLLVSKLLVDDGAVGMNLNVHLGVLNSSEPLTRPDLRTAHVMLLCAFSIFDCMRM
jgi:hypothetical protein